MTPDSGGAREKSSVSTKPSRMLMMMHLLPLFSRRAFASAVAGAQRFACRDALRVAAALVSVYFFVSSTVLIGVEAPTPLWELHEVVPPILASFTAATPSPNACAPCGCSGGMASPPSLARELCIGDAELQRLSALDVPLQPTAAAAEALRIKANYLDPRLSTDACFDTLNDLHTSSAAASEGLAEPASTRKHILWHWYWRPEPRSAINAAQIDALAAWMVTQDAQRSTLIIWVPAPFSPPAALASISALFPGRVRYRILDLHSEAEGTPLERSYLLRLHDEKAWADSDIARLLILWRYGGVYFDTDVLLMRPITPLLGLEFSIEFSCDHAQSDFNNAIMRFFARSPAATALIDAARAKWPRLRQWVFGPYVLRSAYGSPLWRSVFGGEPPFQMVPWCFFHGIWCKGAIPLDAVVGDAPWDKASTSNVFGLHMHGLAKQGRVSNSSVFGTYSRRSHGTLMRAVVDADKTAEKATRWASDRGVLPAETKDGKA
jgi:hypothetical protein